MSCCLAAYRWLWTGESALHHDNRQVRFSLGQPRFAYASSDHDWDEQLTAACPAGPGTVSVRTCGFAGSSGISVVDEKHRAPSLEDDAWTDRARGAREAALRDMLKELMEVG